MVPQKISVDKLKPLRGAPILHWGDFENSALFVELPRQIFQAAH